jgi:hypothetical protein
MHCDNTMKRFAAVLMLSSSLTLVAMAEPAVARGGGAMATYASSGYQYCDAKLIADLWGISVEQAKVQIGLKIQNGIGRNIPSVLRLSRQQGNTCEWEDTGYSYEDAQQLADLWGLDEPYNAKLKVARYVTNGQRYIVDRALGRGGY